MVQPGDASPGGGGKVASVLGQSQVVEVFRTSEKQLRWNYLGNNGNIPPEKTPIVSKFDMLMWKIKTFVREQYRSDCFDLLGKGLFNALNQEFSDKALSSFDEIEKYVQTLAEKKIRTFYVSATLVVACVFSATTSVLLHQSHQAHADYFYGAVFGAVGAAISVMQRATTIDVDWSMNNYDLFVQALIRVSLGALFGTILVMACTSNLIFGVFKDNTTATYVLSVIAGFSERMIPDLFARLEGKADK